MANGVQALQGWNQVIEFEDTTNPSTFIDMSCYLTDGSITFNADTIDVSTFCTDGWQEAIQGLKSLSLNISYNVDATFREWFMDAFNADAPFTVKHYPEGNDTGKQYYEFKGFLTSGGDGGAMGSALSGSSTIQSSGKAELKIAQ